MDRVGLAARWHGASDLRVEPQRVRDPGPGEALVRMLASGVCGSDVHAVRGTFNLWTPPVTLGHEGVGVVEQLGEGDAPASVGDLVSVCPSVSCGMCYQCREGEELLCSRRSAHLGAFADYCTVPVAALYGLPAGTTWTSAVFVEPLACVLHALALSGLRAGEWLGIVGGGTIGQLLVQVARLHGAHVLLSEPNGARRQLGLERGADVVVDPGTADIVVESRRWTSGVGLDRVIEAVGRPETIAEAIRLVRRGGSVVVMGVAAPDAEITVHPYDLYERQLTLRGSFIRNFDFQRAVRVLDRLALEPLVTATFPLDEIHAAIENVASGHGLKTVVVTAAGRSWAS